MDQKNTNKDRSSTCYVSKRWCPLSQQWPSFVESMGQLWWGNVLPDAIDKILAVAPVGSVVVHDPRHEDPAGMVCAGHVRTKDGLETFTFD